MKLSSLKTPLTAVAVAAVVLTLVSCGKKDGGGAQVIKIGHVGPTSGAIAHLGKDNENGAKMAIEELNAAGIKIGDKVVIFSQSLPTLDFIENVLCSDWSVFVSNRHLLSSTLKLGGWDSQVDYYRIDGGTTATDRGALITAFNSDRDSKAFLISIEAGGIGYVLMFAFSSLSLHFFIF